MRLTIAVLLGLSALVADTITLKNGDRLTGSVVTTTDKGVQFKSELAGDVTIPWENVSALATAAPIVVSTKDGKKLTGTVTTEGDRLLVSGQAAERTAVAAVRSESEQAKFEEKSRRAAQPGFLDLYSGFIDFGVANARGNADTTSYNTNANLVRTTANDKVGLRFSQIQANNRLAGVKVTTAQAVRGGINYQRNLNPRLFVSAFNDYDYDKFLRLDLRFVAGGGLGFNAIKNNRTLLTFGGGGAYNRETFASDGRQAAGFTRSSAEAYLNQEFTRKLNSTLNLFERFSFFPNLSSSGEYRINFDTGFAATIYKSFAIQTSYSLRHLSNPPVGRETTDTLLSTGVRYTIPTRK